MPRFHKTNAPFPSVYDDTNVTFKGTLYPFRIKLCIVRNPVIYFNGRASFPHLPTANILCFKLHKIIFASFKAGSIRGEGATVWGSTV